MRAGALLALLMGACSDRAPSMAGLPRLGPGDGTEIGAADAVAAGDLDGDGDDTIVRFVDGVAMWNRREVTLGGQVQGVARGDIDRDGIEEILVATGMGRGAADAPARVYALTASGSTLLWERGGERAQVSDLAVLGGRVWLAAFADRWHVEGGWLEDEHFESTGKMRMAMQQRPLPDGGIVVGRLYGERPRSDGDLRIIVGDEEKTLESHRGVRALALADLGGPDGPELLVGDGWHHKYGTEADPRVVLRSGPGLSDARTIAWLDGDYAAREFEVAGTGREARILVTGARGATLLQRDGLGWSSTTVGAVTETGNAVLVRTGGDWSVALSGDPARLVSLEPVP